MNAPRLLRTLSAQHLQSPPFQEEQDESDPLAYLDLALDNKWLLAICTAVALAIGGSYALLARPVYQANLLIQVEDQAGSAKSILGEAASLFDVKTAASAEIEILRSRMVVGQAVDNSLLYISAKPRYLPLFGQWLSRRAKTLSAPGVLGIGGWVTGTEAMRVSKFDVPQDLEASRFRVTVAADGEYLLSHPDLQQELRGKVGIPLKGQSGYGPLTLLVTELHGLAGAQFNLVRYSRLAVIEDLQEALKLVEKGRQSGVIEATLQSSDATQLTAVLNEIGREYVRQNIERKAAEAEKTLRFLDVQLPQFKRQLDQAEEAYNKYRNKQGTVALDEEAKLILGSTVDMQSKLLEAQQKRRELLSRFTPEHPAIKTLDDQIAAWTKGVESLNQRVRGLPSVQQDAIRLERDVKMNNELYQQLRNNALQLQLVREGKIGNVRLIDEAAVPEEPIKPKAGIVIAISLFIGLALGLALALLRNTMLRGIQSPQEIEARTALSVYSTIPVSEAQTELAKSVAEKRPGLHILGASHPNDLAVESLRSLRTALQFAMLEAPNNRLLITGATPGVGKSFVSSNFAAVLASTGRRVLLIDADLRKGHLNQYFGLTRPGGLSEAVAGTMELHSVIHRAVLPQLDLLTTGVLPPNPAELLNSESFQELLDAVSKEYDFVIVDSPPVLAAADAMSIASHTGTLLVVARAETTQIGELLETGKRLAQSGARITGVVFNAVDLSRRHHGAYGYKYGGYQYRNYNYEPAAH